MTDIIERQVQFISKLVRLSQEGKIEWRPHELGGFVGRVLGRDLRIFALKRSFETFGLPSQSGQEVAVLEIMVEGGKAGYSIEGRTGLKDLLASAAFRAARVDEFMDNVLAS